MNISSGKMALWCKFHGFDCDTTDMDEDEFVEIAMSHAISPHQHEPKKVIHGEKLHDQDIWDWKDLDN